MRYGPFLQVTPYVKFDVVFRGMNPLLLLPCLLCVQEVPSEKEFCTKRKEFAPQGVGVGWRGGGGQILSFNSRPFSEGRQNDSDRVVFPESVFFPSIHIVLSSILRRKKKKKKKAVSASPTDRVSNTRLHFFISKNAK